MFWRASSLQQTAISEDGWVVPLPSPSRKRDNLVRRSMSFHASEKSFDPLLLLSLSFIHDGTRSSLVGCDTFRVLTEPINLFLSPPWKREFLLVKRPMKAANVRSSYSSLFLSFLTLFPLFDEVCFASVPLVYTRRFQRIVEDWFERVRSSMIFESVYFNNWVGLSFFIRWNKKKGRIRLDLSRGWRRTIFLFEEGMETEKVKEIVREKWRQSNGKRLHGDSRTGRKF